MKHTLYIGLILSVIFVTAGCGAGIGMGDYDPSSGGGSDVLSWLGVTTLAQVSGTRNQISWTVPDSHPSGAAIAQYDIRYSTEIINATNFDAASAVIDVPTPSASGETQTYDFESLIPNTTYYAAILMIDAEGNTSAISNIATVQTDYRSMSMPAIVANLTPMRMVVGDVDGDGYDDVLVGDNGSSDDADVYLFFGGPDLSLSAPAQFINPTAAGNNYFATYLALSDVNGDGKMDVLIRYGDSDGPYYAIIVYYGKRFSGEIAIAELDRIIFIDEDRELFAEEFADLGDIDGDGKSEIAVGDPEDENLGVVRLYSGQDIVDTTTPGDPVPFTELQPAGLTANAEFGMNVGSPGDLNADGFRDLVVGAPDYGAEGCGRTYVFFGSADGFSSTPGRTIDPTAADGCGDDEFSYRPWTEYNLGDLDGDGHPDLITTSSNYPSGSAWPEATIKLYPGGTAFASQSPQVIDLGLAYDITPAGDVNDDGIDDLLVVNTAFESRIILGGESIDIDNSFLVLPEQLSIICGIGVDLNNDGAIEIMTGEGAISNNPIGTVRLHY